MKLRNKKTGEIRDFGRAEIISCDPTNSVYDEHFCSLSELNEKWEDAPDEEPKLFYVVDLDGEILPSDFEDTTVKRCKKLGNYFETKEQAEKAVEKLKAWKRLKDKGVRPTFYMVHNCEREFVVHYEMSGEPLYKEDLMLLFGGKE